MGDPLQHFSRGQNHLITQRKKSARDSTQSGKGGIGEVKGAQPFHKGYHGDRRGETKGGDGGGSLRLKRSTISENGGSLLEEKGEVKSPQRDRGFPP